MTKIPKIAATLMLALLASLAFADLSADSNGDFETKDGLTISANDMQGNPVQYRYNKDRLLVYAYTGTKGITYTYTKYNLLAYATYDDGSVYSALRDREDRIILIFGVNSTTMTMVYSGHSKTPIRINIQTAAGQPITMYSQSCEKKDVLFGAYSPQAIDQYLMFLYENFSFQNLKGN